MLLAKQIFFFILGIVFMILGVIGLALPVVPQIPFLLVGISCMCISSKRFQHWIVGHSWYQKHLKKHVDRHPLLQKIFGVTEEATAQSASQPFTSSSAEENSAAKI